MTYSQLWSIQEPLLAMAGAIEVWFRFSGKIQAWKDATAEWWFTLQTLRWPNRNEITHKFYDLFCAIYGAKVLSVRRFIASTIGSYLFLYVSYYFISGILSLKGNPGQYTYHGLDFFSQLFFSEGAIFSVYSLKGAFLIGYGAIGTNLIPDFISLAETGIILKFAMRKNAHLGWLVFVDILLTAGVWIASHWTAYWFASITTKGTIGLFWDIYNFNVRDPTWFCYALTTFSTSILWWLFLVSVFTVIWLKRVSKFIASILESSVVAEIPLVLIVGIPCLLSWPALFLIRMFAL